MKISKKSHESKSPASGLDLSDNDEIKSDGAVSIRGIKRQGSNGSMQLGLNH